MKKHWILAIALVAVLALTGFGFGWGYKPVKLYPGAARPDTETSALVLGVATEHMGEHWVAMLVGVDGTMCPAQFMAGDNSPTPKHMCGNISVVLPGEHVFTYALQTGNQIGYSAGMTTNSWKRLEYLVTATATVEPGTIYGAKPAFNEGKWSVSLFTACKSKKFRRDAQWFYSRQKCP